MKKIIALSSLLIFLGLANAARAQQSPLFQGLETTQAALEDYKQWALTHPLANICPNEVGVHGVLWGYGLWGRPVSPTHWTSPIEYWALIPTAPHWPGVIPQPPAGSLHIAGNCLLSPQRAQLEMDRMEKVKLMVQKASQ